MRLSRISALTGVGLAVVSGCGDDDSPAGDARLRVVATTTQVADLARQVGGERVEVKGMLAANTDPHEYEPRPSDAESVTNARIVLRSGGDLDEWMDELVDSSGSKAEIVDLIESVRTINGSDEHAEEEGHGGDEVNPHWWHDPTNAIRAVGAIRAALAEADPDGRDDYALNANRYEAALRSLDAGIRDCMARVPASERKLVTTHDALPYFAKRYGIDVVGSVVASLSTEAQPSAGDTAKLIDQVKSEGVKVVFSESSVNSKVERAIARQSGARIGDSLWADTLGPKGSSGDTYLKSVAANARAMVRGFTGGRIDCRVGA
jgi:ABC-type Zn uptake system ZnuABC Zn-binding protein ZnuA